MAQKCYYYDEIETRDGMESDYMLLQDRRRSTSLYLIRWWLLVALPLRIAT